MRMLSGNAIDHLLLILAGMHIGRAVCAVSSAHCRLMQDHSKVHSIFNTLRPGPCGPSLGYEGLRAGAGRQRPVGGAITDQVINHGPVPRRRAAQLQTLRAGGKGVILGP